MPIFRLIVPAAVRLCTRGEVSEEKIATFTKASAISGNTYPLPRDELIELDFWDIGKW